MLRREHAPVLAHVALVLRGACSRSCRRAPRHDRRTRGSLRGPGNRGAHEVVGGIGGLALAGTFAHHDAELHGRSPAGARLCGLRAEAGMRPPSRRRRSSPPAARGRSPPLPGIPPPRRTRRPGTGAARGHRARRTVSRAARRARNGREGARISLVVVGHVGLEQHGVGERATHSRVGKGVALHLLAAHAPVRVEVEHDALSPRGRSLELRIEPVEPLDRPECDGFPRARPPQ